MNDPRTFWLVVTNIVLGAAVVFLLWGVLTQALCDFVARRWKRHASERELDEELKGLFGERAGKR